MADDFIDLDDTFKPVTAAPKATKAKDDDLVDLDDSFKPAAAESGLIPVFGAEGQVPAGYSRDPVSGELGKITGGNLAPPQEGLTFGNPFATAGAIFKERLDHAGGTAPDMAARKEWGADGTLDHNLRNLPADIAATGANAMKVLQAGLETGAIGLDAAVDATGINTLLPDQYNLRPGAAAMALLESTPDGGLHLGMPGSTAAGLRGSRGIAGDLSAVEAPHTLSPDIEAGYDYVSKHGTAEDMVNYAAANKFVIDPAAAAEFVKTRDAGGPVNIGVSYIDDPKANALKAEADAFTAGKTPEAVSPLEAEAAAFKAKPEDVTPEALWPTEEATAAKTAAMEEKLAAEAEAFKGKDSDLVDLDETFTPAETPKPVEAEPAGLPKADADHISVVDKQVRDTMDGWAEAPDFEVVHSVDDIKDPALRREVKAAGDDAGIQGVLGADGKVHIIAKNIEDPSVVPGIVFHEALGHNGMTKLFGDELDSTLKSFYDTNKNFRSDVDAWMEKRPTAYEGQDVVARAADEVLAEMSEAGRISPQMMDVLKNKVKDLARKMGIKANYSDREIRTILGMAHDAVIKGKGSVAENGFRTGRFKAPEEKPKEANDYRIAQMPDGSTVNTLINSEGHILDTMDYRGPNGAHLPEELKPTPQEVSEKGKARYKSTTEERREKIKAATAELSDTKKGETKTTRPFKEDEPDYYRFRHVTEDGKPVTGTYTVSDGKLRDFSINSEGGARAIGPKAIRQIGRDLMKEHPEAKGIDGYRISGAREGEEFASSGARFSKKTDPIRASQEDAKIFLKDLGVYNNGELSRMPMEEAVKKASRLGIDTEYVDYLDAVRAGEKPTKPDMSEYMPSPRFARRDVKKSISADSMETVNDVNDLLDLTHETLNKDEKIGYSIPELTRMASDMNVNAKKYLNQKGVTEEKLAARLLAAKQVFANTTDELAGLGERFRKEGYSPSLHAEIRQKLAVQEAVAAKLDGDTAEVGRALRVLREVTASKKSAQAQARYMAEHGAEDILADPKSIGQFLDAYLDEGKAPNEQLRLLKKAAKYNLLGDILNVPRTIMSSFDLSAPLRQGLFLVGRPQFWKAYKGMFKQFASEEAHQAVMKEIQLRPTFPMMMDAKLGLTDEAGAMSHREELFMSKIATQLPGVKHSERAYNGFLNKLRADIFDDMVTRADKAGVLDMTTLKAIGEYINNATGRGTLGRFEKAAPLLTSAFFSPRLIASRVNLLNPKKYWDMPRFVQKEAARDLVSLGGVALGVLAIAKLAGAEVEDDARSSDFGKIKIGNTRMDIGGGFNQYITLAARVAMNQTKTPSGVKNLGEGYKPQTRLSLGEKFLENKASPIASAVLDFARGTDAVGEKNTATSMVAKRMVPLLLQDIHELYSSGASIPATAAMATAGVFGVGINTFKSKDPKDVLNLGEPVMKELQSLDAESGKHVVTAPRKSFKIDGESVSLGEQEYASYSKTVGEKFQAGLKATMALPGWKDASSEIRREAIKETMSDAVAETKEELYGPKE